ncbi:uncharacterized protein TRIVIDRAFT_215094 [Trichoderma virens Gv29-8]|uniref:Uncharacterized protein n=1 Tax=Hypocrea virens (strain Gv29-8 / FGSC 10586) TaxID=413071 RepID=G9MDX1_HYPVG|nr:uncharacterized protein TRIVIDRAFT_215094 [Trichoderma virens Gv29-8]EHK27268.1 hypothetical protein TRIVIDRAFT_215094 [Trichoderma virens Gv29-8]
MLGVATAYLLYYAVRERHTLASIRISACEKPGDKAARLAPGLTNWLVLYEYEPVGS